MLFHGDNAVLSPVLVTAMASKRVDESEDLGSEGEESDEYDIEVKLLQNRRIWVILILSQDDEGENEDYSGDELEGEHDDDDDDEEEEGNLTALLLGGSAAGGNASLKPQVDEVEADENDRGWTPDGERDPADDSDTASQVEDAPSASNLKGKQPAGQKRNRDTDVDAEAESKRAKVSA